MCFMVIGIGLDTGGTCTDAVAYDFDTCTVLAKGKALTTKEDLTIGIGNALDVLPREFLTQARIIALSTTLATNACVENKGGRAKLILMGTTKKVLEWIDAQSKYGLKNEDVLCVDTHGSFDGKIVDEPDWEELLLDAGDWLADADALSVAEVNANNNGSVCEKNAKVKLEAHYNVPIVLASELVSGLNVMERGATALLNARLLPVIQEFLEAVRNALIVRDVHIPAMIVRSDGSLMSDKLSRYRPVETILSGPAASVLGARGLTDCKDCLTVDMGGTTTDISLVKDGVPVMVNKGIHVGGWRTQVKGIFTDTFALGGDSAIRIKDGGLELCARRVQPLCVAATKWPEIKDALRHLLDEKKIHSQPLHEFLYLVREPKDVSRYHSYEIALCDALSAGPCMLGNAAKSIGFDIYSLNSERLESEGIVMRCGLTPTDIMHIKGDFSLYDKESSELAARHFLKWLPHYNDDTDSLTAFLDKVYDLIKQKLYENIVRVLLTDKYPKLYERGVDEQMRSLVSQSWVQRRERGNKAFSNFDFTTAATFIGIGAPTHVFLPEVAEALGTTCIIPEHAEVANAIGAVIADVSTKVQVEISPNYTAGGIEGYIVHTPNGNQIYDKIEEAYCAATEAAVQSATEEARRRGALGELSVDTQLSPQIAYSKEGQTIDLGTSAIAVATGRIEM